MNGDSIMQHCVRDLADSCPVTLGHIREPSVRDFVVLTFLGSGRFLPGLFNHGWQIPAWLRRPVTWLIPAQASSVHWRPEIWQIPAQAPWRRDLADSCSFAVRLEIWQIPAQPLSARSGRFLRAARRPGIWLIPAQAKVDTFIGHLRYASLCAYTSCSGSG